MNAFDFKAGDRVKLRQYTGTFGFVSYLEHCENKWAYVRDYHGDLVCVETSYIQPVVEKENSSER